MKWPLYVEDRPDDVPPKGFLADELQPWHLETLQPQQPEE